VAGAHGLDAEHADALAVAGDNDAVVGEDPPAVLRPRNVERQIALVHRAIGGDHVQLVDALLPEIEGQHLGQDWVQLGGGRMQVVQGSTQKT
ncbi:hypothetical protein KR093_009044, partial [Drosophila rubida]